MGGFFYHERTRVGTLEYLNLGQPCYMLSFVAVVGGAYVTVCSDYPAHQAGWGVGSLDLENWEGC